MTKYDQQQDYQWITEELGRKPRGKVEVVVRHSEGRPQVIQVEPMIEEKPFSTLYWLVDRKLHKKISHLEARGGVEEIKERISSSKSYQTQYQFDHLYYIHLRRLLLKNYQIPEHYKQSLYHGGIGGIRKFSEVKCLHLQYAYHLVTPTLVGRMVDSRIH